MNITHFAIHWHLLLARKVLKPTKAILVLVGALLISLICHSAALSEQPKNTRDYIVAAYYFPNWHVDPVNQLRKKSSWTEWETLKAARPKFPGHLQPKIPIWGYEMEDSPDVMSKKIDVAVNNGVNAFIFDWYFHESGTYLEGALNDGFLKAPNRNRIRFALMWANHDLHGESGEVSEESFNKVINHLVMDYFTNPAYMLIDGKPYFSIYEIGTFIQGMGGVQKARDALNSLRRRALDAGLNGVHINVVDWQLKNRGDASKLLRVLGVDSVTSYTWVHHVPLKKLGFPTVDYMDVAERYLNYAHQARQRYGLPYYPNVTMGWDPTPRMNKGQPFDGRGYPNTPVIVGNTPDRFMCVMRRVKASFVDSPLDQRVITINAWNEWGEGSYLEPDNMTGLKYLEAIRDVIGVKGSFSFNANASCK